MTRLLLALSLTLLAPVAHASDANPFVDSYALEANYRYDLALEKLSAVPSTGDTAYFVQLRRGWLLYLLGRYADSVQTYEKALALNPTAEARLGLTLPLMALRRWSEAEQACRGVLEVAPGNYLAQSRLAYVLYSAGRYADAEAAYQTVVTLFPSDTEMRAGLGWAQLKQGKSAAARKAFQLVLLISPDHASATEGLAATGG